jgi:hypothetical protein
VRCWRSGTFPTFAIDPPFGPLTCNLLRRATLSRVGQNWVALGRIDQNDTYVDRIGENPIRHSLINLGSSRDVAHADVTNANRAPVKPFVLRQSSPAKVSPEEPHRIGRDEGLDKTVKSLGMSYHEQMMRGR